MRRKSRQVVYRLRLDYEKLGIKAYVIIDSLVNGLSAGGLRMRDGLGDGEIKRLARAMTHKFAAMRVPIGGAKAGIALDPRHPAKTEVIKKFADIVRPILAEKYIAGEDMGTTKADLAGLYSSAGINPVALAKKRMASKGIAIDLPDDFDLLSDESNLEELMTGYGVAECTEEACARLGLSLKEATVAIQGFGNVGSGTAQFLTQKGAIIVAVADAEGTIYRNKGLPIDRLIAARDELGTIDRSKLDFDFAEHPREDWMTLYAQILVPAAVADTITKENAGQVTARLVVEAANIPVTPEAERQLHRMGVAVVPDFIANAGAACGFGLLLSGQVRFDPPEVLEEIGRRIRSATAKVVEADKKGSLLPRKAAEKLAETELAKIKKVFG